MNGLSKERYFRQLKYILYSHSKPLLNRIRRFKLLALEGKSEDIS
jgi:hypothetical protein